MFYPVCMAYICDTDYNKLLHKKSVNVLPVCIIGLQEGLPEYSVTSLIMNSIFGFKFIGFQFKTVD